MFTAIIISIGISVGIWGLDPLTKMKEIQKRKIRNQILLLNK